MPKKYGYSKEAKNKHVAKKKDDKRKTKPKNKKA